MDKDVVVGGKWRILNKDYNGGLTYSIISIPRPDVSIIDTRNYGRVQIYVDPSTKAVIK